MIRRAIKEDIPTILELLHQVCMVHHNGRPDYFKDSVKYNEDDLLIKIKDDLNPIFIYEEDSLVLGYVFCIDETIKNDLLLENRKTLYIDDLCVLESKRGLGIGTKLYEYVKKYAKEKGYYNVTLNVWALNPSAIKFYEKLGLKPLKTYLEEII